MGSGGDPRVRSCTFVANESTTNAVAGLTGHKLVSHLKPKELHNG
jgi:hypothetical protein